MFEVYRHHDSARVGLIDGILRNSGIETFLKNWTGSNITEIPIPSLYPTICILRKEDVDMARQIISEFLESRPATTGTWLCTSCGETVEAILGECWSCQASRLD